MISSFFCVLGSPSETVFATPIGSPPLPPANVLARGKNSAVNLSWDQPVEAGGINRYEIDTFSGSDFAFQVSASMENLNVNQNGRLSFKVENLQNSFQYSFSIRAINEAGSSIPSKIVTATPNISVRAPSRPRNVSAEKGEAFSVQVQWRVPLRNGGSSITDYSVRLRYFDLEGRQVARFKRFKVNKSNTNNSVFGAIVRRLAPALQYEVSVRAISAAGKSNWSLPAFVEV